VGKRPLVDPPFTHLLVEVKPDSMVIDNDEPGRVGNRFIVAHHQARWLGNYPLKHGENGGDYATRVLTEKYGGGHPKTMERGAGSEYSKIRKNCERG